MGRSLGLLLAALWVTGCSLLGPDQVVVSAAASLTEAMAELEAVYEAAHPDVDIVVNLAGSQVLAGQVVGGAPADVFASANPEAMAVVTDAGLGLGDPVRLAGNRLAIIVPAGNPDRVEGLAELATLDVVLGAPEVPVGSYTQQVLDAAGISLQPRSEEPNTRAVVARVANGDADAGIAYATDAAAVEGVSGVDIPEELQPEVSYEVVLLTEAGAGFLEFLASAEANAVLTELGFTGP